MRSAKDSSASPDTPMQSVKKVEKDQDELSMSSPMSNLDAGNFYEYTDADAPYTRWEKHALFWEIYILP